MKRQMKFKIFTTSIVQLSLQQTYFQYLTYQRDRIVWTIVLLIAKNKEFYMIWSAMSRAELNM